MKLFEDYFYVNEKKEKKEMSAGINDIIGEYTLKPVFDYKITNFIVDVPKLNYVEVSMFGFGQPSQEDDRKKQDALIKFIFTKGKIWTCRYKKSKIFRKIQNRDTETTTENVFEIRDKILNFLNKK